MYIQEYTVFLLCIPKILQEDFCMKITKYLRFLLIALAAVMAFSLFACTEPEEEESSSVEEPSESDSTPVDDPSDSDESSDESSEETTTLKEDCQHVEEVLEAVAATCEETGLTAGKKCSVCGEILEAQTEVPALGHAWNEGVVDPAPDCDTAGVKTFTCSNDATHTKTEEVPALGHTVATYTTYVANPDGDEAMIAGECSVCGEMGTKPASFFLTVEIIYGNVNNDTVVLFPAKEGEILMAPGKLTFAPGHPNYPADGFAPIALDCTVYDGAFNGMIGVKGWVGYLGADVADGAQFKVVDAEGNVLVEWTNLTQLEPNTTDEGVNAFLPNAFTDMTAAGYRYTNIVDLKPYWGILNGKTVTVELAFTTTKGVDGDVYIPYASLSVVVPACEHVAGEPDIADNCNVKCTKCGAVLEAAKHIFTEVAAVEPTCDTAGNVAHNHCATCGKNFDAEGAEIADVVVPALGHNQVDKTFTAPTAAEDGWYAHKYCEACGTAWSTEGEKLDAVPTIAKIVPTTNKYWGYEDMEGWTSISSKVNVIGSDDRTYVRFERNAECNDIYALILSDNTDVTGQYLVFKYRTDHSGANAPQIWANTTHNGHAGLVDGVMKDGVASGYISISADNEWHIAVVDLAKLIPNYVKTNDSGEYVIQWARIDLLDKKASEGYIDIGFIALTDDIAEIASVMLEGDKEICPHLVADDATWVLDANDPMFEIADCIICGSKAKRYIETTTSGTHIFTPDDITDRLSGNAERDVTLKDENGMPYVSIEYISATNKTGESTVFLYADKDNPITNIGKYVAALYRINRSENRIEVVADSTLGSVIQGVKSFGTIGDRAGQWTFSVKAYNSYGSSDNLAAGYYDGEQFTAFRLDFFNPSAENPTVAGDTTDIAFIAYFDTEAEAYAFYAEYLKAYLGLENHDCVRTSTWDSEANCYNNECMICGDITTSDMIYKTEASLGAYSDQLGYYVAGSSSNYMSATQEDGFVRYKVVGTSSDPYFLPFTDNTTNVTGQYMVIKYKLVNGGSNATASRAFAASAASGVGSATGSKGNSDNSITNATLVDDGEWHYIVITPNSGNTTFTANADGTYTWRFLRINISGWAANDGSCYLDIDEIAFADNQEAVDAYIAQ